MAAAPRAKSDTAARARRDRRRQRMMPGNGADRSVGRGWVTQYPSASKRPPRAKVQPHPPDANVTVLFPPHDGARPRAADLLAKSPDWLKAAPMRENMRTSWRQSGQKQDHCPSLLNHNAKYKRLLPPCCDFANGVWQIARHNNGAAFVTPAEGAEQQIGAGGGQRHIAQLIDDQQLVAA